MKSQSLTSKSSIIKRIEKGSLSLPDIFTLKVASVSSFTFLQQVMHLLIIKSRKLHSWQWKTIGKMLKRDSLKRHGSEQFRHVDLIFCSVFSVSSRKVNLERASETFFTMSAIFFLFILLWLHNLTETSKVIACLDSFALCSLFVVVKSTNSCRFSFIRELDILEKNLEWKV